MANNDVPLIQQNAPVEGAEKDGADRSKVSDTLIKKRTNELFDLGDSRE